MNELLTKIKDLMSSRGMPTLGDNTLNSEIESAAEVINNRRNFTPSTTSIVEEKYKNTLIKMVIHCISKYGAEGETGHSENAIDRSYGSAGEYPKEIINEISIKVKVV